MAASYGPWFITLALGPRYDEAADLFRWLCWVFTPFAIAVLLCQCFNVIGGRGKAATIMAGMTVVHAGLLAHYVGQSPAVATIGSLLVAAAGGMIVALHQIGQKLGLRGHLWWVKFIIVIAAAYAVFEGGWAPLMITAPAALAVGAVLTWLLRIFDADDIAAVRGLLRRETSSRKTVFPQHIVHLSAAVRKYRRGQNHAVGNSDDAAWNAEEPKNSALNAEMS